MEWFINLPVMGKVAACYIVLLLVTLVYLVWEMSRAPLRENWHSSTEDRAAARARRRQRRQMLRRQA